MASSSRGVASRKVQVQYSKVELDSKYLAIPPKQRIAELESRLVKMTKIISERVKAVASRKTRVQGWKDELKIRDQALRQLVDYFTFICYVTDPHVKHMPPVDFLKDREPYTLLALKSLHKKPNPNPVMEEQITAELRAKLSLVSKEAQKSEYACRREMDSKLVAKLEAELDLSLKKLAELDNMSASAHAEEKDLESELEWKDQLLNELAETVDKMYEIEKNLLAELAALGDTNPVRILV